MTQDDPVVERVRAARRRIVERCGFDRQRLYEWIKKFEAQHQDRVVGFDRASRIEKTRKQQP